MKKPKWRFKIKPNGQVEIEGFDFKGTACVNDIIYKLEEWKKQGQKVIAYGHWEKQFIHNDVKYDNYKNYRCNIPHKNVILWRLYGCELLYLTMSAQNTYVDLHDRFIPEVCDKYKNKINKIFVKSEFHKNFLNNTDYKYAVIVNGVRNIFFEETNKSIKREQFRFIYASCYTRGLEYILTFVFPKIRSLIPEATLHIFYGMDSVKDENFKSQINTLLNQENVFEYGKQSMERIIEEKLKANFHLYPTNSTAETDCISIKESALIGCIPIISNYNVFYERSGIHVDINTDYTENLVKFIRDNNQIEQCRTIVKDHISIQSWQNICNQWLNHFKYIN